MVRYQIHKKFLSEDFCNNIINNYKNFSEYTPRGKWNAWTVGKEKQDELVESIQSLLPSNLSVSWINITKYEEGESLRIHTDSKSKFTVVVNLNDNYNGGEFVTNKKKHILEIGDIVTFNGNKVQHGVQPVTEGVRYSLNFWFTDGKL